MPVFCNHLDVSIHGWMVLASETRVFVSFRYKYDKYVSIKCAFCSFLYGMIKKQYIIVMIPKLFEYLHWIGVQGAKILFRVEY